MKCLTVFQPWAWAVVHGHLNSLGRCRQTLHRGLLVIHAARSRELLADAGRTLPSGEPVPGAGELVFGALIGCVQLVECFPNSRMPWLHARPAHGPWRWHLDAPLVLAKPIPCMGGSHVWDLSADLEELVRPFLGAACGEGNTIAERAAVASQG
jgi:hypothetical protein